MTGVMPLTFTANNADVAGFTVPWWVPVVMLAVVATAIAYTLGISGGWPGCGRVSPPWSAWARCCSPY